LLSGGFTPRVIQELTTTSFYESLEPINCKLIITEIDSLLLKPHFDKKDHANTPHMWIIDFLYTLKKRLAAQTFSRNKNKSVISSKHLDENYVSASLT